MRGKGNEYIRKVHGKGITPAHAGKSSARSRLATRSWDHPRPCGEKGTAMGRTDKMLGSPPPMRGKEDTDVDKIREEWITPAHAGKSCTRATTRPRWQDHPRPCGEKSYPRAVWGVLWGSPPPMRGKGGTTDDDIRQLRITPAHAGKRCRWSGTKKAW